MADLHAPQQPEIAPLAPGLRSETFPAAMDADGKTVTAQTAAFARTAEQGFYEPWFSDEQVNRIGQILVKDEQTLTAVYVDQQSAADESWGNALEQVGFDPAHPVGTFVDYDKTLNAGGPDGPLPARLITVVTVNPSFRRRGILKHLMTSALSRAVEDGMAVAALTVSEGGIYGRFGFGCATREANIQVDLGEGHGQGFALRNTPAGRVISADPAKLDEVINTSFESFHNRTRGSIGRQQTYQMISTARWNPEDLSAWNRKLRAAVHVREDGSIGGYVTFQHEGWDTDPSTIRIHDLIAADDQSHLALWDYIAGLDIVRRATMRTAALTDPLQSALANPRSYKVTGLRDLLWVRILDVVKALEARAWSADGAFRLELEDAMGITGGSFTVRVHDGAATVTPAAPADEESTEDLPTLQLSVETLGSLYLGDVSVRTLHAAGRLQDTAAEDVEQISRIIDLPTPPFCATHF
ncbi:acetyltransferase [Nesterenkonia sp. AN1]|uniref:Putative acetyltransferase n=1 Tax=Nesterenkonia aurantiaca TaxID=1436010 RepID=A0A4R7FVN4_9MICC|nr:MULTISPECIES: GNAT family N-acetyltransferase [Nesterenkonia]EXF25354.1 acetyltransferase [Nesterenkonia sp. AN1]TDS82647.1 putative acetyltransferase [Nesterenkonia aurantiaca]